MQKISCYLYPNRINVVADVALFPVRWNIVYQNRVKIYQGVTLGALSVDKNLQNKKRHPTIEDDVVIYAHATILGGDTVIGRESIIGGNVWITKSITPHSVVYHRSEIKLDKKISECDELIYEI